MNNIKKIIGLAVTFGLSSASTQAAGSSAAQFLKMGAGARPAAMGDAYSSVANDATAAYWNPAGLSQLKNTEIAFMHNSGLVDTQYQYVGVARPMGQTSVAASLYRMDYGTIDGYDVNNVKTQNFDASDLAASLSLSRQITDRFSLGLSAKYISQKIENESATGFAGDIGGFFKEALFNRFNFGFSVQNLGSGIKFVSKEEKLPIMMRAGLSTMINEKLLVAADLSKANDSSATAHLGADYRASSMFSVRGGYKMSSDNGVSLEGIKNLTAGAGVHMNNLTLDYAFSPFGDLGSMHRISLSYQFSRN